MYCPKCGTENDDYNYKCLHCDAVLRREAAAAVDVPSYLVHAILCTLFCCMPFGIVAIVYAAQTSSKSQAGDMAGAQYASEKARLWCWISFLVGLVPAVLWLLFVLVAGVGRVATG